MSESVREKAIRDLALVEEVTAVVLARTHCCQRGRFS